MRRAAWLSVAVLAAVVAATVSDGGMAWASHAVPTGGILATKHNLSPTGPGPIKATTQTYTPTDTRHPGAANTEVCVYCHTPHGADTAVAAPLWNRPVSTTTYLLYSSPTMDSAVNQPSGVSLACLSCHDGTIAFDALRNVPGSGGYTAPPGVPPSAGWGFATPTMPDGITRIAEGGNDLRNDHPISMVYADGKSPSSGSADETTGFQPQVTLNGRLWVQNTGLGTQVPLYDLGRVQCASCHDPHRSDTSTFLRVDNGDQSKLCRTCHKKDA